LTTGHARHTLPCRKRLQANRRRGSAAASDRATGPDGRLVMEA
jgi:hypothetical protein